MGDVSKQSMFYDLYVFFLYTDKIPWDVVLNLLLTVAKIYTKIFIKIIMVQLTIDQFYPYSSGLHHWQSYDCPSASKGTPKNSWIIITWNINNW